MHLLIFVSLCGHVCVCVCQSTQVESRGQLPRVSSPLPLLVSEKKTQSWQQVPLLTEPPHQPLNERQNKNKDCGSIAAYTLSLITGVAEDGRSRAEARLGYLRLHLTAARSTAHKGKGGRGGE